MFGTSKKLAGTGVTDVKYLKNIGSKTWLFGRIGTRTGTAYAYNRYSSSTAGTAKPSKQR